MFHEFGSTAPPHCIFKVNFAALLSAISEKMPELAYEVNVGGSKNMLDLGKLPEFYTQIVHRNRPRILPFSTSTQFTCIYSFNDWCIRTKQSTQKSNWCSR